MSDHHNLNGDDVYVAAGLLPGQFLTSKAVTLGSSAAASNVLSTNDKVPVTMVEFTGMPGRMGADVILGGGLQEAAPLNLTAIETGPNRIVCDGGIGSIETSDSMRGVITTNRDDLYVASGRLQGEFLTSPTVTLGSSAASNMLSPNDKVPGTTVEFTGISGRVGADVILGGELREATPLNLTAIEMGPNRIVCDGGIGSIETSDAMRGVTTTNGDDLYVASGRLQGEFLTSPTVTLGPSAAASNMLSTNFKAPSTMVELTTIRDRVDADMILGGARREVTPLSLTALETGSNRLVCNGGIGSIESFDPMRGVINTEGDDVYITAGRLLGQFHTSTMVGSSVPYVEMKSTQYGNQSQESFDEILRRFAGRVSAGREWRVSLSAAPSRYMQTYYAVDASLSMLGDADLVNMWAGAWDVIQSDFRDRKRQAIASLRSLVENVTRRIAPSEIVHLWCENQAKRLNLLDKGRPTRRARWLFILTGAGSRHIIDSDLKLARQAADDHDTLSRLHTVDVSLSDAEVQSILAREGKFLVALIRSWSQNCA